ncbi:MAG: UpxY family transcription antiterminator [Tannerella sp.]|jgi:transcription antitermination factor NusG|nr:UpxY family transcription antiterminator [Tannerella sp.]
MTAETVKQISSKKRAINWHVLYTRPRSEKRVHERIEKEGIECYLPLHRTQRAWSDRVKLVDIPLISSYVFVKCKEYEVINLLKINGVVKVVFNEGKPALIRETEIDAIKEFLKQAEGKTLVTGDEVEILVGSMKKRTGKIIKIKKKYIYLHIEQLSATVCININSITPLNRLK